MIECGPLALGRPLPDAVIATFATVCVLYANVAKLRNMLSQGANPYTPGAGQQPTFLSGRDRELEDFASRLSRLERGRGAQCTLIVGLRGVGKTVLLNRFAQVAADRNWIVVDYELTGSSDLLATVGRLARQALLELDPPSSWSRAAKRTASVLRGMEVSYSIAGLGIALSGSEDPADSTASGDPARDVSELFVSLGEAAKEKDRGIALLFDELQFASAEPLGALVAGLHKVAQRNLPITAVAAGLPQTRGVLAEAASYSERMFETRTVEPLSAADATRALAEPAREEGVVLTDDALALAVLFTDGYPFFLQVFGDHMWRLAGESPIDRSVAERAQPLVRDWLDRGFFTFRTDRLPVSQRRYLRAMAELGAGEQSSGDIAEQLGVKSSATVGQTRDALIRRGLIYSPRLGYAAFTVPQFDDYLRRHFELELHQPRKARQSG